MGVSDRNYWVRTEHGRVWGPFTLEKLERLRGQLTEKCDASLDGQAWRPGLEFPELKDLLAPARKIEKKAPEPQATPRISKAIAQAFGIKDEPPPEEPPAAKQKAAPKAAAAKPAAAAPAPAPRVETPETLPESGDLAEVSPARLYALAALQNASGWLQLEMEKGHLLQIAFRRGTPENLSSDDPDLSLVRWLLAKGVLPPDKALAAEEQAQKSGQDVVSVLFGLQLIPAADAHKLLGDYAFFLLDRALVTFRGKFTFEKDAPPPPGAFPLGSKWGLLAESVRRLEVPLLRARMGKRLLRPVVRSGGLGIGKVDELALNAQEARLYASIDGTRSGEDLLKSQDAGLTLRLLYLLTELGHLSFAEVVEESTDPELEPLKEVAPPPPEEEAPKLPKNAERGAPPQRELPKTAREAGRSSPPQQKRTGAPPVMKSAPPVLQPSAAPAPAKPAPQISRPPPTFANGPEGESPAAMQKRITALFEKLSQADHFEALGMERKSATAAEAKRNFFVLAKTLHPDTVSDPAQADLRAAKERLFARINEAAQVLGDDKRRKEYEEELDGKKASVDVARIFGAEENFQKAEILIKARKYKEGLELLEKAISMNDKEAEFYAWRGYARFLLASDRKAAYAETSADCQKAIKMQEVCLPAHLFLGHMAKVVGELKLAKKCYQRVLELDDKHVEAQRELRLMGQKA
jgi:tetratricopeptide (TPR) repeat protein